MKFDTILEYQRIDQELLNLESEFAKSKERAAFVTAKAKLEAATDTVNKLSQEASDLLANYNKLNARAEELKMRLDEFDRFIGGVADVNEADYYLRQIASISDEIAALEKDAARDYERIDGIDAEYKKTCELGVKASKNYKAACAEYNAYVTNMQPKVAELKEQLSALKKSVPTEFMEAYLSLRSAKKMPAFVVYNADAGTCGRCFLEVSADTKSKLRNPGDYAECPNCRRILFIPEN